MATFVRRVTMGALVVVGLLAGQGVAHAQFSFGWTRYGYNPSNPFVAQQQYIANLQAGRLSIAAGQSVPAWLPYLAPYAAPAVYPPYIGTGGFGGYGYGYTAPVYNPYTYGGYGYSGFGNYGVNPYLGNTSGYLNNYGTSPYSSSSYNPYLSSSAYSPYSR